MQQWDLALRMDHDNVKASRLHAPCQGLHLPLVSHIDSFQQWGIEICTVNICFLQFPVIVGCNGGDYMDCRKFSSYNQPLLVARVLVQQA